MKKRLRKKTHRGEFKELGFVLTANYEEKPDMTALCDFVELLTDKFDSLDLDVSGYFDFCDFDIMVNTGIPCGDEATRREQAIDFVKTQSGILKVEASDLVDAWHNKL
ncbi:MAG: YggL family protein [Victivallales bacterium]|jgi:uncharacterized protein YggL (DUF469 family)|nr:YggL family protein [Victivallales bacterium]